MESNNNKSVPLKGIDSTLDISLKSDVANKVVLASELSSAKERQATKTMLEDVCTDFESMDVFSSKNNNKVGVIKNAKSSKLQQCSVDRIKSSSKKKDALVNKTAVKEKVSDQDKLPLPKEEHSSNVIFQGEENSQPVEVPAASEEQIVEVNADINGATVLSADSVIYTQSELLPLTDCETSDNVTILTNSTSENLSSLAQLADAEIVQTDGNVSIIVTNTRLIKVLTNADSSMTPIQGTTAAVIDPNSAVLETDEGATQEINLVDPSLLTRSVFQSMAITDDSTMLQETVISEKESSSVPKSKYKATGLGSGRGLKRPFKATYTTTTPTSKARRVTAKMKTEWVKQLEKNGHLSCQMPGCSQTYVTIANFQTHYKYCTGKKRLQHCLYCDSLIFSTHKAILHHMEVEHPDKVQEYKDSYSKEETDLEESNLMPHLLISEDDNVAMNIEEVTQQPPKKKRKLSLKENVVLPKKAVLKHKIQSIQNSMAENTKEFKKCVRFDNIIDKINSVDDTSNFEAAYPSDCEVDYPDNFEIPPSYNKPKPKGKFKRVILTESIVEKKYFEDDEDVDSPRNFVYPDDLEDNPHTKARMMLNMERYKRYKEYLILTRDWSSARKTYSRKRDSDASLDSSVLVQSQNESVEDVHQLNDTIESSSISLNTSETEINPLEMPSLETDLEENVAHEPPVRTIDKAPEFPPILSKELPFEEPGMSVDKSNISDSRTRKEKTCYGRASLEAAKSKPLVRYQGIITYGVNVPGAVNKHVAQPLSFDSLVDFLKPKLVRRDSQTKTNVDASTNSESIKASKEDGIKHPVVKIEKPDVSKRKRGRPPKPKPDVPINAKVKVENSKKYSAAMLKSIERSVNRKVKLFGVKKNFKVKSKKLSLHMHAKKTLKTNQMKQSKRKQMAKCIIQKKSTVKVKSVDESAIQCEENIDNRLSLGNTSNNISNIECLSTDHYTPAGIVENQTIAEVEVHTSNAETISDCGTELGSSSIEASKVQKPLSTNMSSVNTKGAYNKIINEPCMLKNDSVESNTEVSPLKHDSTKTVAEVSPLKHDSTETVAEVSPLKHDSIKIVTDVLPQEQEIANVEKTNQEDTCKQQETVSIEHNLTVDLSISVPSKIAETVLQDKQMEKDSSECEAEEFSSSTFNHSNLTEHTSGIVEQPTSVLINNSALSQEAKQISLQGESLVENSEEKMSEIPVKRRRGRPRKNANAIPLSESPSFDSPIPSVSKHNTLEKSLDSQSDVDSPVVGDGIQTPFLRKSERVKRRRIATEEINHSMEVEKTSPKEKITPKVKTTLKNKHTPDSGVRRGRGRPRKYPLTELVTDLSEVNTDDPTEKHSEVESESVNGTLRKFSRKGRPRKCVRYVDLNAGLDSSESLDGLGSGKDKLESSKVKGKTMKKPNAEENKLSISESHDSSYDQDGQIILPLKKRKQRQTRKDDLKHEKVNTSNEKSENLSNEEMQLQDGDKDEREVKNLRNLRGNRKGVKRKRKDIDTSDEDWELPDHFRGEFRNNKNSPQAAQRKSTNREIREMEEETSYSSGSETIDRRAGFKKGSRKSTDASLLRRYASKSISRVKGLDSIALKESLHMDKILFSDQKPQRCMWKLISGKDYYAALPPLKTSAYFKVENVLNDKKAFWNSLNFFDSAPLDKESCHSTFFTGGPVLCSAWCPTPSDNAKVQYVALATSCYGNKVNYYVPTNGERGLLQLWNVGVLSNKLLESKPFMELGISHQYSPILDMAWCPFGCWENPSSESLNDNLPRLGMLALACIDGNVRIYSIPHPQFLPKEETCFRIYSACPSIVLEPMYGGICGVTKKSLCSSITWQNSDNCERLAAGYANGMICVWRINTSATILAVKQNNQTIISPYLVFNSHGTPVSSVAFSMLPGSRYLVSSSTDRTLKFWDLIDTSLPFYTVKKGSGKCAEWVNHYCGVIATFDYGMESFRGATFFRECGTENLSTRVVSNQCCSVTNISMSKWLNAHAIADVSGAVSVSFVHNLVQDYPKSSQYFHRPAYLSELKLVDGIFEKVAFSSYPESVDCIRAIQETTNVADVVNQLVEMCCKGECLNLNSLSKDDILESQECSTLMVACSEGINCVCAVEEMEDIIDIVHEVTESCEKAVCVESDENTLVLSSDSSRKDLSEKSRDSSSKEGCEVAAREDECMTPYVPDKVSEMADIVTLVADMNTVTNTLDHLMHKYQNSSASQSVSEDTLMEVDADVPLSLSVAKQPAVETICDSEIKTSANDIIKSILEVVHVNEQNLNEDKLEKLTCISTLDVITNVVSDMEDVVEKCHRIFSDVNLNILEEKYASHARNELKKSILVHGTGLPYDLSEMTDIVEIVTDLKDTAAAVGDMADIIATATVLKDVVSSVEALKDVVESEMVLNDVAASATTLKDIVSSVVDLREVTVIMEQLKNETQKISLLENLLDDLNSVTLKDNSTENHSLLETFTILSDVVKNVSKIIDEEQIFKNVMGEIVSNVEQLNKFEEVSSSASSHDVEILNDTAVAGGRNVSPTDNAIITVIPSTNVLIENENSMCSSLVHHNQNHSCELSELPDKLEVSMLADDESSNSENDMYSDDELQIDVSGAFDQESNFSEESVLSECTIDSTISMGTSSSMSDTSEASSDSIIGKQENEQPISNIQCDPANAENVSEDIPLPSLLSILTGNLSVKLPSMSAENNISLPHNLKGKSETDSVDAHKPAKMSNEVAPEGTTSLTSDSVVPDSQISNVSLGGSLESCSNEPNKVGSLESTEDLNDSQSSEMFMEIVEMENVSSGETVDDAPSDKTKCHSITSSSLPIVESCDNDIGGTAITNIDFSNESCTESTDINEFHCIDNTNLGNNLQEISDINCNPPNKPVIILDTHEIPETPISNQQVMNAEECRHSLTETNSVVNNGKNSLVPNRDSSYEDVMSQYGIVFKDMNTADFRSIENRNFDVSEASSFDQYHINSIKTVAWNPNFGSHFWLFSASQSGIARLSYVSDINEPNTSDQQSSSNV